MSGLAVVAMITQAVGTVMNAKQQRNAADQTEQIAALNAENTNRVAKYNAKLAEKSALSSEASSQIAAKEAKRQAELRQSRVLALVAASGGSAMDVDIMNIIAGFEEEGDLEARNILYEGTERARTTRAQGQAGVWEAKMSTGVTGYEAKTRASGLRSASVATIMGGASSLAQKYGSMQ